MPDPCASAPAVSVAVNSPVLAGGDLTLHVADVAGVQLYHWTGPNGYTADGQDQVIYNVQPYMAGTYKVEAITTTCVLQAYTDSVIVNIPTPSCTVADNTATISGAASLKLSYITSGPSGGSYFIKASGGGDLELEFPGTARPTPGLYNIRPLGDQWNRGDVRLRLVATSSNWPASSGKLYVTLNNSSKLSMTYCNVPVYSQTFYYHSTSTGKVTEP